MRYQNWDVLMFPHELCKIPMQEFKTTCQVIQDPEFHPSQNTALLLPTVTCFVPGLPAGDHFRISIHSWQNPEASRYIHQINNKHAEHVVFEARVFLDGRLAGSKLFHRNGPWPTVLETSIELDKQGDYKKLEFPAFHRELLSQSYWNPGDDLGRVKVVIAEGFPLDNISMPFERVKNLVAFSFQHAPLDVLETSSIAWPNASMWRQVSVVAPFYGHHQSPPKHVEDIEAHSHSPRKPVINHGFLGSQTASMPPPPAPFSKAPSFDPFTTAPAFTQWRRQASSTDTSMPDVSSVRASQSGSTRNISDPMVIEKSERQTISCDGGYDALCEALLPPAPVNTPQNGLEVVPANTAVSRQTSVTKELVRSRVPTPIPSADPKELAAQIQEIATINEARSRRVSSSSVGVILSRKENNNLSPANSLAEFVVGNRRSSHPFTATNITGTKRQRNVTPASSKVIDDEDEPALRSSPSLRKVSRQSSGSVGSLGLGNVGLDSKESSLCTSGDLKQTNWTSKGGAEIRVNRIISIGSSSDDSGSNGGNEAGGAVVGTSRSVLGGISNV